LLEISIFADSIINTQEIEIQANYSYEEALNICQSIWMGVGQALG
jgi:hypothetical protein